MFLQKSPSKFTGGISALWRGMNLTYLNNFFLEYFQLKRKNNSNLFLYESARSAILHILKILDVKYEQGFGIIDLDTFKENNYDGIHNEKFTKVIFNTGWKY